MNVIPPAPSAEDASQIGLSTEALQRIAAAVAAAEAKTSAEIRVVVRREPLIQHPFYSIMWAALVSLVAPWPLAIVFGFRPLQLLAIQAAIFMVLAGVFMLPNIALRLVPRLAQKIAARGAALEVFLSYGIPQTKGRTGIVIFTAAQERRVEVVADEGVHTPLGHAAWQDICERVAEEAKKGGLADGLIAGAQKAGDLLSGPYPPRPGEKNELDNHVILL